DVHERRFAGAVLAEQRVDLAALDDEVDAVVGDQISEAFGDAGELQFHLTPSCPKRAYGGISGQVREHPALLARTAPKCGVFSRSARRVRGESDLDLTGDDLVAQLLELGLDLVEHLRVEQI